MPQPKVAAVNMVSIHQDFFKLGMQKDKSLKG